MARPLLALVLLLAFPASAVAIVRGQPAEGDWPFVGYLEYGRAEVENEEGATCTLSLVTPRHALTAAHCIEQDLEATGVDVPAALLTVVLGRRDKRDAGEGERIAVAAVTQHEGYDPAANVNDLALLELERPATAAPVRIAGPGEEGLWAPGTAALALGWGFEYFDQPLPPDVLNQGTLYVRDGTACPREGYEPRTDLCTHGGEAGTTVCFGDSGGPLLVPAPGGVRLVGVLSWMDFDGDPCEPGSWSFYMRIGEGPLREWLAQHVPEAIAPPVAVPAPAPPAAAAQPAPPAAASRPRPSRRAACLRKARRSKGARRARAIRRCRKMRAR